MVWWKRAIRTMKESALSGVPEAVVLWIGCVIGLVWAVSGGGKQGVVNSFVLAALPLIATRMVQLRKSTNDGTRTLKDCTRTLKERIDAKIGPFWNTRRDLPAFGNFVSGARRLCVYAPTAASILSPVGVEDFRQLLEEGCEIQLIVMSPEAKGLEEAGRQFGTVVSLPDNLRGSLASIDDLRRGPRGGHLFVKHIATNPGFGIVMVDREEDGGIMNVEFHGYGDKNPMDLHHVRFSRGEDLFEYWSGVWDRMWDDAKPR
jgi:hypothetical protein